MNTPRIIYDSNQYMRQVLVGFNLYNSNWEKVSLKEVHINRVIVSDSGIEKRVEFYVSNEYENEMDDFTKEWYGLSDTEETHVIAAFSCTSEPNVWHQMNLFFDVFFYGMVNHASNKEIIFTTYLHRDDNYILLEENGKKIETVDYASLVQKEENINEEEKEFVETIMKEQLSPSYFLTEKEYKDIKKELDKEKKQKEKTGLFQKKKEEPKKEAIQVGENEFVNPKSLKIQKGSLNPEYELNNIIGLENVKEDIREMRRYLQFKNSRQQRGVLTSDDNGTMHMCFMGRPGTGKTTIARIMTGILFEMKYIKENKCIEVNGLDLKGGYVGQTGIITKKITDMARGGVLFIDEAYSLCEDKNNSFGKEAISVLLKEMEDNRGDLIVIFAGYEDDINRFLDTNVGFRSRINKYFKFEDYTTIELGRIFTNILKKMHLKITGEGLEKCIDLFKTAKQHANFSNGRFARNLSEQIEEVHILNVVKETGTNRILNTSDFERMDTITIQDIPDIVAEKMLYGM